MKSVNLSLLKIAFYAFILALISSCSTEGVYESDPNRDSLGISNELDSNGGFIGTPSGEVDGGSEEYNEIVENPFIKTSDEASSTFSVDADGAAYGNMRRFLNNGQQPPVDALRTEELVNYFNYNYRDPMGVHPISLEGEISSCPWNSDNKLMRIGIKGKSISRANYPASNLVFLIDVSGSMKNDNKLPLLKEGMLMMIEELKADDRVAIVTYASNPGVALESTSGEDKATLRSAVEALAAGGSTNGEGGIKEAYRIAEANFIEGGNNRIIMGTDGDFNVGISSEEELVELIEIEREKGIFLTIVGLGTGNLKEGRMEQLANNGNGNFEYIDNKEQARKVFVNEYNKFFTVAKDVKIQVEFNDKYVEEYRLIGYENRLLATEDFEDDKKDAGEIGAGQSITALYELKIIANSDHSQNAFTIDFRYKLPDEDSSRPFSLDVYDEGNTFSESSNDHQFAAAVASFGLLLRDSDYKGNTSFGLITGWADRSRTYDPFGYKREFIDLIALAQ